MIRAELTAHRRCIIAVIVTDKQARTALRFDRGGAAGFIGTVRVIRHGDFPIARIVGVVHWSIRSKLTPFRQGYLLYMQGAWPMSELKDQRNPYAEDSDEWGAFRQGEQHAMSDVPDVQDSKEKFSDRLSWTVSACRRS